MPTIDGTFKPLAFLDAFDGELVRGRWRLEVADSVLDDTGTLNRWCVHFQKSTTARLIFADGFEAGNAQLWSNAPV